MDNLILKDGEAILLVGTRRLVFDASDVPLVGAMFLHLATDIQLADFFDSVALPKKLDAANAKLKRKRRTRAEIDADKAAETAAKAEGAALAAAAVERSRSAAEATRSSSPMKHFHPSNRPSDVVELGPGDKGLGSLEGFDEDEL